MSSLDNWEAEAEEIAKEAWRYRGQRNKLLVSCKKLVQAMVDYQMEVEDTPPFKHRKMMREARANIYDAEKNP